MFANPLGLIALLAVPVVVGLHLYRRRFSTRTVSATFLWAPRDRSSFAGRKRAPLRRSPSFWLELLAALLLALALAGPRACGVGVADHLVVVLDGSASMGAVRGEALDAVEDRVDRLSRRDRVTVVVSGPAPRVLVGPEALGAEVDLQGWQPASGDHELGAAVDLALELAGGAAVVLVTDGFEPEPWGPEVEVMAVGVPAPNVGIVQASRVPAGERDAVFVGVRNAAGGASAVTLEVWAGESKLQAQELELAADETASVSFELEPTVAAELRLSGQVGALEADDRVALAPLPRRTIGLGVDLPEELERHLGLDRLLDLVPESRPGRDLVIAEAPVEGAWTLVLGGEGGASLLGPFLLDKAHPLLDGVSLQGLIWTLGDGPGEGVPLVSAGNRPLLVERRSGSARVFELDMDPWSSTLHRSPDWPILLLNLAELRRGQLPGLVASNLLADEELVWVGAEPGEWTLDDAPIPFQDPLVVPNPGAPGWHTLARDGQPVATVAVRTLDVRESDLRDRSAGLREAEAGAGTVRAELSGLDTLLLLLALSALCLDWFVLRRERT